jgi:tetratricopeptide (TPR) repeat protein
LFVTNLYPNVSSELDSPGEIRNAMLAAEESGDSERVLELATRACEVFPGDAEVTKVLGIILYARGNYAKAAELLKTSAEKKNNDARLFFHLGMAQYWMNERVESKAALQSALSLGLPIKPTIEARWALSELSPQQAICAQAVLTNLNERHQHNERTHSVS